MKLSCWVWRGCQFAEPVTASLTNVALHVLTYCFHILARPTMTGSTKTSPGFLDNLGSKVIVYFGHLHCLDAQNTRCSLIKTLVKFNTSNSLEMAISFFSDAGQPGPVPTDRKGVTLRSRRQPGRFRFQQGTLKEAHSGSNRRRNSAFLSVCILYFFPFRASGLFASTCALDIPFPPRGFHPFVAIVTPG